jgi:cytochrome c biogenesis protein CcmG/thiol:disulfide interchange protein DsbE
MRVRLLWPVILALAALVGLLAYGVAAKAPNTSLDNAVATGQRVAAPGADTRLPHLTRSGQGSVGDYKGKVVLLNFWGSWCPPCKEELPLLQRTHERIGGRGGMVLGVDEQDTTDDALATVRRYGLTYPSLRDPDRAFARRYGTNAYPETFVLDREGRVAALNRGPVTQAWLDRTLPPLLTEGT